jgi:sugar phosphate isomerase/epimerase
MGLAGADAEALLLSDVTGMRLGYNTNGFASHRLRDALHVIAGLGFRSVAVTLDAGALDPYDDGALDEARRLRDWLAERDVLPVVETGARFLLDPWRKHWPTLLSPNPEYRRRRLDFLERAIDVAAALGAPVVSLWAGTAESDESRTVLDERLAEGLRALCSHARDHDVVIGFEPEPGMHVESMADFRRIRALVDDPALRLTLDVGHAHITEASAPATIRECAADIVNVHLEGMLRDRHDHLLPGEGDLDLAAVVDAFREVGYSGPANLELSRHSHMAVDAARWSIAFFRPLGLP